MENPELQRPGRAAAAGALAVLAFALLASQIEAPQPAPADLVAIAPAPAPVPSLLTRARPAPGTGVAPPSERPAASSAAAPDAADAVLLRVAPLPPPAPPRRHAIASAEAPAYPVLIPVAGIGPADLVDTFTDPRDSTRIHKAIDILAPTGTPVVAATGGRVVRLYNSSRGGLTIYQRDEAGDYVYYYAHLDGYAPDLKVGQAVAPGDTLGYVGYTGNADAAVPHLHFAIWKTRPGSKRLSGRPVNPYPVLAR
ncbi:MAG: M23 family metallopeptidase [Rhodothermales bacterium]|nr:M23 family metallopeptidase [Rhodothermales bacterium]